MMSACNSEMVQIYMYIERKREVQQNVKLGIRNRCKK